MQSKHCGKKKVQDSKEGDENVNSMNGKKVLKKMTSKLEKKRIRNTNVSFI